MREIRTFELDPSDPTTGLALARTHTLRVRRGQLWMTIEADAADLWLEAGASVTLPARTTIWVSAHAHGSRFDLVTQAPPPAWLARLDRWLAGFGRRGVVRSV
ncbi:MAG: hypothetical protein GAK40_00432 [Burkholderia plantarii]|nr:MAG: hypothetical protein GAK40_00432 [Burkholderia plantarii]